MENVTKVRVDQIINVADGLKNAVKALEAIVSSSPSSNPTTPIVPRSFSPPGNIQADCTAFAEQLFRERRKRDNFFDADHFGEPQWDLLLDLFVAGKRGRQVSVSSACIAASVPPTTALRHIVILTEHGHIERVPDPYDSRRVNLRLCAETTNKMELYIAQIMAARSRANIA